MSKDGVPGKTRCFEGKTDEPFRLKVEFVEMKCGRWSVGPHTPNPAGGLILRTEGIWW